MSVRASKRTSDQAKCRRDRRNSPLKVIGQNDMNCGNAVTALDREAQSGPPPRRLAAGHHPVLIALNLPRVSEKAATVERELGSHAAADEDRCCGYFPALTGVPGIHSDLPACQAFATWLPLVMHGGTTYRFNFLRLSLRQQSIDPAYHLDSDAATALTGDLTTLKERRVVRLILNLSSHTERTLHYLDVDPYGVDLVQKGSYVCAADPRSLSPRRLATAIPARRHAQVAGLLFPANLVLHSGVDNADGHFVAAYGIDTADETASFDRPA
jgi:hypothetical protein